MKNTTLISLISLILGACNSGSNPNSTSNQIIASKDIESNLLSPGLLVQNGDLSFFPSINSIVPAIYNLKSNSLCSGTFLDERHVLTAAHCVLLFKDKPSNLAYRPNDIVDSKDIVILSSNFPYTVPVALNSPNSYKMNTLKKISVHEGAFKGAETTKQGKLFIRDVTEVNDLAILELEQPVALGSNYKYPKLAALNYPINTPLLTAGYGVNNGIGTTIPDSYVGNAGVLRVASTRLFPYNETNKLIDVIGYSNNRFYKSCQGDSGGPDFVDTGLDLLIVGVHSFGPGTGCGKHDSPDSSINVFPYLNWIKAQITPDAVTQPIENQINSPILVQLQPCLINNIACTTKLPLSVFKNSINYIKFKIIPSASQSIVKEFNLDKITSLSQDRWEILKDNRMKPYIDISCFNTDISNQNSCNLIMKYSPQSINPKDLEIEYSFTDKDNILRRKKYLFKYTML